MNRYFLAVRYKGTAYHGWQIQPNAHSVQAELENKLSILLKEKIGITGSGRTDAGVHCGCQYAHFDTAKEIDTSFLTHRLNAFLPADISILNIRKVQPTAHARFDAFSRTYHYHLSLKKNPFKTGLAWHYKKDLNIERMNEAALLLLNYKDFECFSKKKAEVNHFLCDITHAQWTQNEDDFIFVITANRFLWGMVRAIVGTLSDVGNGKLQLADFERIIKSKDRNQASAAAPPQGLFLMEVGYPEKIFDI